MSGPTCWICGEPVDQADMHAVAVKNPAVGAHLACLDAALDAAEASEGDA